MNELPKYHNHGTEDTLENDRLPEHEDDGKHTEEVQEETAEERKEAGYQ